MDLLVSHFGISSGAVTIAFDGKAALDAASSPSGCRTLSVSQPCFDYLQVIHNRLASLPITVHWRWVRGHQRERGITDVDWWGEMNDVANTLAKELLSHSYRGASPAALLSPTLLHEKWTISIFDKKHSRFNSSLCYDAILEPWLVSYWESCHDIPIPKCQNIDWKPGELAI